MRRLISTIGVIFIMLNLGGCSLFASNNSVDERKDTETMTQQIIAALDNKDADALKNVFSPKAISMAEDLDKGVAYIFSQYEGSCIDYVSAGPQTSDHFGSPGRTKMADVRVEIETDKGKYVLYYRFWLINETDPDALGVYRMRLFDYSEWEDYQGYVYGSDGSSDRAGIFQPSWVE